MSKISVVQFLPYAPPHMWWLETHAQEWAEAWIQKKYGEVYNITSDIWQISDNKTQIVFQDVVIWYIHNGVHILVAPSIEIISGFPCYKIRKKQYKYIIKYIQQQNPDVVITRTRFFLTSYLGWLFAKKNKIKRVHIEHGSGYVKLSSRWKNVIAYIYDRLFGSWIFHNADIRVWVSKACKKFMQKFVGTDSKVHVIHRWLTFLTQRQTIDNKDTIDLHKKFPHKKIIGFLGRLYKRKNVATLIDAYYKVYEESQGIQLVVVGDGEDLDSLKEQDTQGIVDFVWWVPIQQALAYQEQFDIHVHSSSQWWWLATTLLQAMFLWNVIVATPYEWADEVLQNNYNGILLSSDSVKDMTAGIQLWLYNLDQKEKRAEINRNVIKKEFTRERNIDKYYSIIKEE